MKRAPAIVPVVMEAHAVRRTGRAGAPVFEPAVDSLLVACFCERRVAERPQSEVRRGIGWSCGRDGCDG